MLKLKDILYESFETARQFFLNPQYNEKTFADILKDFEASGGQILGQGSYGMVLWHRKWRYTLKIFTDDVPYLRFVRFAVKNPRPSFPVFYDIPRRIYPNYKRGKSQETLYLVKMEKLNPISQKEFDDIEFFIHYGGTDFSTTPRNYIWKETEKKVDDMRIKYPSIDTFLEDQEFLFSTLHKAGSPDMDESNVMKRDNGEFILTDPFWEGETPYQRHDRLQKAEIDYYGYDEPQVEPQIMGGKRYKKPKPPKPVKYKDDSSSEEIPFQ